MNEKLIYRYVERLGELIKVGARQAGAELGLQPIQLEVLHYLSVCNQYSDTPMAVTEYLGQTKGTVSQTLKVLEKKELIRKEADASDKRVTHLKVTVIGQQLIDNRIPTKLFLDACTHLSPQHQVEIAGALKHLLTSIIQSNNMKSFGVCSACRYNKKSEDGSYFCNLVKAPLLVHDIQLICREHENA